ncbi:hypothetical protein AVEN_225260-1 [Araneus ventricosus]|uniref:Reverse transcriptase zinc-binding domain-containing protein n=1 Tax=Araneus ventricosus TaxID=182803 RepID=A0A4Y2AMS3_ARAVE|nr:hypothetical protein AVEN_225260-1 [Araneus ventricosus]
MITQACKDVSKVISKQPYFKRCFLELVPNCIPKFFPTVKYRLERNSFFFCSFKVTQFLTGHGNFGEYLKRFHRQTSDVSDCSAREIQNEEHIVFLCLQVDDCRKVLQQKLGFLEKDWTVALISLINTKSSFLSFTEFVRTCKYK